MSVLYENSSQNLRLSQFPSEWENIFTLSKQVSLSRMRQNRVCLPGIPRLSGDERLDMPQQPVNRYETLASGGIRRRSSHQ
jgi:hypothetical protein